MISSMEIGVGCIQLFLTNDQTNFDAWMLREGKFAPSKVIKVTFRIHFDPYFVNLLKYKKIQIYVFIYGITKTAYSLQFLQCRQRISGISLRNKLITIIHVTVTI